MDPEDLQDEWLAAKQDWDASRAAQLRWWRAERRPTEAETARLEQARARFQAAEQQWDEAYRAGVVIDVGDDPDGALARLNAAVTADPLADAPRLAYADAVTGADPERAEFIRTTVELTRRRAGTATRPPGSTASQPRFPIDVTSLRLEESDVTSIVFSSCAGPSAL